MVEVVASSVTQREMGACCGPGSDNTGFYSASVELLPLQMLRPASELSLFPKVTMSLAVVHILFTHSADNPAGKTSVVLKMAYFTTIASSRLCD